MLRATLARARWVLREVALTHAGYVAAFLMNPYGRHQLTSKIYGGVVDELTAEDTREVLIPDPPHGVRDEIGGLVVRAFEMRDLATELEEEAIADIEAMIRRPAVTEGSMKRKKHPKEETRGRPGRQMPEQIPDTPENIMRALVSTPPKKRTEWDFLKQNPDVDPKQLE